MEKIFKATLLHGKTVWTEIEQIIADAGKNNFKDMGT